MPPSERMESPSPEKNDRLYQSRHARSLEISVFRRRDGDRCTLMEIATEIWRSLRRSVFYNFKQRFSMIELAEVTHGNYDRDEDRISTEISRSRSSWRPKMRIETSWLR
ncbi:hypothetical protein TIFTF001_051857 [Ficus carica]|uniref:Uncharacterized protein n=1 Tax=Ficus carica TaxID=3494 RepID=A0AA88JGS3_FICCA|nr:hypothetical protein TIFTF001_051857 [Ficus carica]